MDNKDTRKSIRSHIKKTLNEMGVPTKFNIREKQNEPNIWVVGFSPRFEGTLEQWYELQLRVFNLAKANAHINAIALRNGPI